MGRAQARLDTEALRVRGVLDGPWRPAEFRSDEPVPDEMVDALIWALAEFAGEHDDERSAFSEAKHPRNPKGSPGGGRFKSIAARVIDALEQHHAGKGDGDPLKEFNREQVRKVAKARGIELKRGASEADIKKALIDHAAPSAAKAKTKIAADVPDHSAHPLDAGIKSGVKSRKHVTTGGTGSVELVTFNDGSRAIHKKHTTADAKRQTDASVLAATTAEALGVKTPAVRRINNREIYMEYVASPTAYDDPKMDAQTIKELAASEEGRRLGLFDLLIGYDDRSNRENWSFDGGHVTALDHDTAWDENAGDPAKPPQQKWMLSPFDAQFVDGKKWKPGSLPAEEADQVRAALERLAPQFETLGRKDWHDFTLTRLAAMAAPSNSRNHGSDLISKDAAGLADRTVKTSHSYRSADPGLSAIAHEQGFDGKPRVATKAEIDKLVKAGAPEVFRGVGSGFEHDPKFPNDPNAVRRITAAQVNEQFRTGDAYFGVGIYGNGYYFTSDESIATGDYADGSSGSVVRAVLPKDAKIADTHTLQAEQAKYHMSETGRPGSNAYKTFGDLGRYAAARGYDALRHEVGSTDPPTYNYVILNRSALVAQEG